MGLFFVSHAMNWLCHSPPKNIHKIAHTTNWTTSTKMACHNWKPNQLGVLATFTMCSSKGQYAAVRTAALFWAIEIGHIIIKIIGNIQSFATDSAND
jgi:hypothetical protein